MIAGALEIQLLANMARLVADMQQAKHLVSSTMRDISSSVDQAKSVLAGLGVSLTASGLALIAKRAIDAADAMNDLSKSTGIAVDKLAGLRMAAKQSGGDLEGIAQSINKLSVNIGKNGEKFAALGVTAKDPLEAFKQLADVFKDIDDPQLRAAVGAEALGKQWASAAPLLAEGGQKIGEMVEKGAKLSGMTKELAESADAFNDKLVELGGNGGTLNGIMSQMLPVLNKLLDDFIALKGEGGGLGQVLGSALTEALRAVVVLAGNVAFVLRGIGTEIGGIAAQVVAFVSGDFARASEIGRMMTKDAEAARAKFDAWEASIMAVGTAADKAAKSTKDMSEEDYEAARIAKDAADVANKKARAFLEAAEAARKAAEEIKRLRKLDAKGWVDYAEAVLRASDEEYLTLAKIAEKYWAEQDKMREDDLKGWVKYAEEVFKAADEENLALAKAMEERSKAEQARWGGFIDGIEGAFRAGWDAFGSGAKNAAQVARDALKRTLYDWLWQAMAKPFILNIVAGGANALGLSGLGSAATLAAGGANSFGGLGSIFSALAGPEQLSGPVSGMASFLGSAGSVISTAMPYIAAAAAIYSLFAKSGGGPKEGGSYFGQFTSFGDYLGQGRVPGTDNGRFFTPSGQDSAIAGIGSGAAAQYYASARALGINAGAFSFGLGFDTDPRGTAPNRVSSGLVDASGRTIYGARDMDIGRDSAAITPALQLEASRMVAAAIKASELPAYLRKVFDGLVVDTATQQQIDDAIAAATALKQIFDVVSRNPMEDLATQIEAAQDQYGAALKANAQAIRDAIKQFDGSTASTQKLSAATVTYYNAQLQLMAAIAQVSQQINSMFEDTFRNIQLAGLDNQGKYNFYQQDAEAARKLLAQTNDPEMVRQLTSRIIQDINSAFGLLTPEEQKAMSAQFIEQGKQAQQEANDVLTKIQKKAAEDTSAVLKEIKELIGAGADDQKAAANTQLQAASLNAATANRGTVVTVRIVDSAGNPIVNGG